LRGADLASLAREQYASDIPGGKGRNNFHNRERSTSRRKDNNVGQTVNIQADYQSPTINLDLDGRLRK